ncbi:peptidylprolyl isomerase [Bacteroidota bacterium]
MITAVLLSIKKNYLNSSKGIIILKALVIILVISGNLYGQKGKNPVLLTVAGEKVTKSEFLNIYNKNNIKDEGIDQESLNEYLGLFINFKLKVKEAEELGYDTTTAFISELQGYRKQLAQPYLTDKSVIEELIKEAYNRMQYDIRFSHILLRLPQDAPAEDTLKAYKKIMKIRDQIIAGADFNKIAMKVSEDYSARDTVINGREYKGNKGELGYFTVFDIPFYDFESAAYNTKEGEISMPVRTRIGYHIIKVIKKKKALGRFQVAYILKSVPSNSTKEDSLAKEQKINEIYQKILDGADFAEIAKEYSDDKSSAAKGGMLPWYGVNKLVPEFIDAVSELKNIGDVSKPVLTTYGWNIIKLEDKKPIGTYDEMKGEIKQKITKDERSNKSKQNFIKKLKLDYQFKENKNALADFYSVVDTTIFQRSWSTEKAQGMDKLMFSIKDSNFVQQDFARYLSKMQRNRTPQEIQLYVDDMYEKFVGMKLIAYENGKLEDKYPEFKALMKEYHDGILLFNLMQEKVWTKAVKDTIGLEQYYNANKNNYMWGERADVTIYTCVNEQVAEKTRELAKDSEISEEDILMRINADTIDKEAGLNLIIENKKLSKGDNEVIDGLSWQQSMSDNYKQDEKTVFYIIHSKLPPQLKTLEEAKGHITSDYQDYLEKQWIEELKAKYPVKINEKVLNKIK